MARRASSSASETRTPETLLQGIARVGCSGWHYKSWRGPVYPADLPIAEWLRHYSRRFTTVELNNSFYRLPSEATFDAWRRQVGRGFLFSVKASRFLTHIKRLKAPDEAIDRLLSHARALGAALGPLLYQLPPRWFPDPERLETFLAALPHRLPGSGRRLEHVIEMRDPDGYDPWVLELLDRYGISLCIHDMPESATPLVPVGPIVYVRFHGHGAKYGGSYPDEVLTEWAAWLRAVLDTGRDAYVYFNNDINGYAVENAERFRRLLQRRRGAIGRRESGSRLAAL